MLAEPLEEQESQKSCQSCFLPRLSCSLLYQSEPNNTINNDYSEDHLMFVKMLKQSVIALSALCLSFQTIAAVSNGAYLITSQVSGKPAEVAGASTADAANVQQWGDNGGYHQHWNITSRGNGYYSIINRHSGKAMEVYNWNTADGGNVVQYGYWGGDSQLWSIDEHGNGVVSFINKFSGKALDLTTSVPPMAPTLPSGVTGVATRKGGC